MEWSIGLTLKVDATFRSDTLERVDIIWSR